MPFGPEREPVFSPVLEALELVHDKAVAKRPDWIGVVLKGIVSDAVVKERLPLDWGAPCKRGFETRGKLYWINDLNARHLDVIGPLQARGDVFVQVRARRKNEDVVSLSSR